MIHIYNTKAMVVVNDILISIEIYIGMKLFIGVVEVTLEKLQDFFLY